MPFGGAAVEMLLGAQRLRIGERPICPAFSEGCGAYSESLDSKPALSSIRRRDRSPPAPR
jgi:hypothetical protein